MGSASPTALDDDAVRSQRIVADHIRAALTIAAAGVYPSASRQGYVLRRLMRRSVRHAQLLTGTDQVGPPSPRSPPRSPTCRAGAGPTSTASRASTPARSSTSEVAKFSKALRHGLDVLHREADSGATFDGDFAFKAADTLGYPAELALEEAERVGMTIDPGWQDRYEELRHEQQERSRG